MRYEVNAVMHSSVILAIAGARGHVQPPLQPCGVLSDNRGYYMLLRYLVPASGKILGRLLHIGGARFVGVPTHARQNCHRSYGAGTLKPHVFSSTNVTPKGALQPAKCNASATREVP